MRDRSPEKGAALDPERARLQIQIVAVTLRAELRRGSPEVVNAVRVRSLEILDLVEAYADGDPELSSEITALRQEIG